MVGKILLENRLTISYQLICYAVSEILIADIS